MTSSVLKKIQQDEETILLNRIKFLNKLPKDISENRPLKENLLTLFICIFSRTPLFICGKPGSSKTISVNIIKTTFNTSPADSEDHLINCFNGFKHIDLVYLQGSDQSTDRGIEKVFKVAIESSKKNEKVPLVFFDEIGLAELSPYNPLKVLHKYLDYGTDDIKQQKLIKQLLGNQMAQQLVNWIDY